MKTAEQKLIIWLRLDGHFIDQDNIRGIRREGKGTKISLITGHDLLVNVDFDKVKQIFSGRKL